MRPYDDTRLTALRKRSAGWLQRALLGVLVAALAVMAFFFLTVALIAGAFIALAVGVRLWWLLRRVRMQARNTQPLEGEYTVIERPRLGR